MNLIRISTLSQYPDQTLVLLLQSSLNDMMKAPSIRFADVFSISHKVLKLSYKRDLFSKSAAFGLQLRRIIRWEPNASTVQRIDTILRRWSTHVSHLKTQLSKSSGSGSKSSKVFDFLPAITRITASTKARIT